MNRKKYYLSVFAGALILYVQGAFATTHIVNFGGSLGMTYSPSSLSVKVGDTVEWQGSFTAHPLSSTTIPATAVTWHVTTGTTFYYVIKVAGDYAYICDYHYTMGMIGSFSTATSEINSNRTFSGTSPSNDVKASVSFAAGISFVTLEVPQMNQVVIKLFDLAGHQESVLLNKTLERGTYSFSLNNAVKSKGLYFVKVSANGIERVLSYAKVK